MNLLNQRLTYLYALTCVVLMICLGFYLQFWKGIAPCPLCILQRAIMASIGILFFIGTIISFKRWGRFVVGFCAFFFSLLGALVAGRQVWIQHLPSTQSVDCNVSLEYMLRVLPWDEVVKKIFTGTAECSLIDWSFWGLSMAEWSLFAFIIFSFFTLWQMMRT